MKKKLILSLICFVFAFSLVAGVSQTARAKVEIGSKNAILIDAKTGQILYGKSPYDMSSSGDFNKLLTIITALEEFEELPDEITVRSTSLIYNPTPPYLGLKEGQTVKFMDMIYAMYLGGYNDAANVVADELGRQLLDTESKEFKEMTAQQQTNAAEDAFAKLMNRKADELLCPTMKSTNPDGHFYDTQQCSPNDIAQLIRSAVKNDTFRQMFMTPVYTITGNPAAVNDQHADAEDKYDNARAKYGEDAKAEDLPKKPVQLYPYPTDTLTLEATNSQFEIKTTNQLFSGEILYNGITGGINAYNKNMETYHSMVYAKNNERSLIAVVMNSSEEGFYNDLQALLNFGFYQYNEASITERELNKMLPSNIASKKLAFYGDFDFLLPADYTVKDLEYAVAYTENGYLSGTITLTLPQNADYAGTIATIPFYETYEKTYWKPILIGLGVILGIILIVALILFLKRAFGPEQARNKTRAIFHRTRKTAQKQRMKQQGKTGANDPDAPIFEKGKLYTDPYGEPPGKKRKTEKSNNRLKAEAMKRKKEERKRSNRRKTNKNI
ncbi:MAG: D-alanyl-D-alanine carboxypeptidase [Firmicutes bacterium]|nr:D-alanyl-D-alanine carboxypeptidase [Bacillota bacterium]